MSSIRPEAPQPRAASTPPSQSLATPTDSAAKRREILIFLLLAFVIWPFLAVAVVGGYGFLVWISQMIMGPPGPPPV